VDSLPKEEIHLERGRGNFTEIRIEIHFVGRRKIETYIHNEKNYIMRTTYPASIGLLLSTVAEAGRD
jgi:hypothetical protein